MNGLQLLKDYPKAAVVVKQWYLEKMLESINGASVPDDFKELVRKQEMDDERVGKLIDASNRNLFDIFDNHKIYIQITVGFEHNPAVFRYSFDGCKVESIDYQSRKDAELEAMKSAFKLLNDKL